MGDWGRERGDMGASIEELEAGRRRIALERELAGISLAAQALPVPR